MVILILFSEEELLIYVISDLHLGSGSSIDNFKKDYEFSQFVDMVMKKKGSSLVINGDFIDFVQIPEGREKRSPFSKVGADEKESLHKLDLVIESHHVLFDALQKFVASDHRLIIIPGNHDIDLFWPSVQARIVKRLGNPNENNLKFELSGKLRIDEIYIEHGNQHYSDSCFENFTNPFIRDEKSGEMRLERSWATCFLEYFVDSLREKNPFVDNVKPITSLVWMGLRGEGLKTHSLNAYRLIRFMSAVGFPPMKTEPGAPSKLSSIKAGLSALRLGPFSVSRKELAEVLSSGLEEETLSEREPEDNGFNYEPESDCSLEMLSQRDDVLSNVARKLLSGDNGIDVVVFGHDHRFFSNEFDPRAGGKKGKYYINTGTWIPMLFLSKETQKLNWHDLRNEKLYKNNLTYALIRKRMGRATARLKVFNPDKGKKDGFRQSEKEPS